jgi:hypothetical protein
MAESAYIIAALAFNVSLRPLRLRGKKIFSPRRRKKRQERV